jgi:hypothetical protein
MFPNDQEDPESILTTYKINVHPAASESNKFPWTVIAV